MPNARRSVVTGNVRHFPSTAGVRVLTPAQAITFSSPQELLDFISALWAKETRKRKRRTKAFAAVSLGTVMAAKLLIRLGNHGHLRCEMDPEVVHTIEIASDHQYQELKADT
jgi:hypothetical protein